MNRTSKYRFVLGSCIALALLGCGGQDAPPDVAQPTAQTEGASLIQNKEAVLTASPVTALPKLPPLTVTSVTQGDHGMNLAVAMMDKAVDYRVYALPKDGDVVLNSDGSLAGVKNAIYRCAGDKEVGPMPFYDDNNVYWDASFKNPDGSKGAAPRGYITPFATRADNVSIGTMSDGSDIVKRQLPDATLGYVYLTPGTGKVPVYALGNPDIAADVSDVWLESLSFFGTGASRVKTYTTDTSVRTKLLAQGWRDDDVAFYAPAATSASTHVVSTSTGDSGVPLYYANTSAEYKVRQAHGKPAAAFNVLNAADNSNPDIVPLMRVNVGGEPCWRNEDGSLLCRPLKLPAHDELTPGLAKFNQVYRGKWKQPYEHLTYSWDRNNVPKTLVVEALGVNGCPWRGLLAPQSVPAGTQSNFTYNARYSLQDLAKKDALGQVYINGQHDNTHDATPTPIARAFITVAPVANAKYDFMANFGGPAESWTVDSKISNFLTLHQTSPTYDAYFWAIEDGRAQMAPMLGSMWIAFSDWAADTGGVMQLTPKNVPAQLASNSFVHAFMDVDAFTTRRRYPQIIISDYPVPIGPKLIGDSATVGSTTGHAMILQTKHGSARLQIQFCDRRNWNTNNQCPYYDLETSGTAAGATDLAPKRFNPVPNLKDLFQEDLPNRFEIFASTGKTYVFFNNKPYGCADLSKAGGFPAGKVNVSYGQVQYHSSADEVLRYQLMENIDTVNMATDSFHAKYKFNDSVGHLDNFGYSSNVTKSAIDGAYNKALGVGTGWNESLYPCTTNQYLFTE